MDTYYTVRALKGNSYEVARFDSTKAPTDVYTVRLQPDHYSCSCPGFQFDREPSEHKHIRIVRAYKMCKPDQMPIFTLDSNGEVLIHKSNSHGWSLVKDAVEVEFDSRSNLIEFYVNGTLLGCSTL